MYKVLNFIPKTLPNNIEKKNNFPNVYQAYENIHFPIDKDLLQKSILRLKYEELFFLQLSMTTQKLSTRNKLKGYVFKFVGNNFNDFFKKHLPFELDVIIIGTTYVCFILVVLITSTIV
ncbi:hypothetical protein N9K77_01485 [bacterium]|nr:hypothetical protein [bacterium]